MNFKKGASQPSGFSRASGTTLSASKSNTVIDGKYKDEADKYPIKDDCRGIGAELQRAKENIYNLSRVNRDLNSQLNSLSSVFTIKSGTSYIGYTGISGVSFESAFEQAYVSGGGGFESAYSNLFVKNIKGNFFWGRFEWNALNSISRGEGFFVKNFGSDIVVDWGLVK